LHFKFASKRTASAATVAGSFIQAGSGIRNNEELGMPLHSKQVANDPQSSLQLATILHEFGRDNGSQISLFGMTRSAALMMMTMRSTPRL
jgi:hypothetical protein